MLVNHEVMHIVGTMSRKQRTTLLREVIDNMAERGNPEEIARFLGAQLGGDDLEVVKAHANRGKPKKLRPLIRVNTDQLRKWNSGSDTKPERSEYGHGYRDLLPDELASLRVFASENGHRWKDILSMTYWYHARIYRDRSGTQHPVLHRMRNEFGPTWLASYTLPQV